MSPHPVTGRRAVAAGAAVGAAAALIPSTAARAAEPATRTRDQCVESVIGRSDTGELITTAPTCFTTLEDALASVGYSRDAARVVRSGSGSVERVTAAASVTIGVHFDGANRTGASITVSGDLCDGGYLNLSSDWINRISSTFNECPNTRFFDGFDKTGTVEATTLSTVNLSTLNNAANSILYAG
jgi:hypothetical protein